MDCVRACLAAGVDVDLKTSRFSVTPLGVAIKHSNYDCIEYLLQAGARIYERTLEMAGEKGSERLVNLLLKAGADASKILNYALYNGQFDIVKLLLTAGSDVNKYDSFVCAVASGSTECVNMLLEAGADVNSVAPRNNIFEGREWYNDTPLFAASKSGSLECIDILLKA